MEVIAVLLLVPGVWWLVQRRPTRRPDTDAWSAPRSMAATVPSTEPPARARRLSVIGALSRIEARVHARSLSFFFGLVFTALGAIAMIGWIDVYDNAAAVGRAFLHFGVLAYPATGMAVVTVNRSALRDRRDGTLELFATLPTSRASRTAALIASAWPSLIVVAAGVVSVIVANAGGYARADPAGGWGPAWPAETLLALALVVGGAALGVALARWLPTALVAPLALVGVLVATLAINGAEPFTHRGRYFAPWTAPPTHLAPEFMTRPSWEHLVYVVGLVALVGMLAMLRDRRDAMIYGALGAAAVVTAIGGVLQLQGPSARQVRSVAALVDRGGDRCLVRDHIRACTYPGYERWRDDWIRAAREVFAVLPSAPGDYSAVQRVGNAGRRSLDPQVRSRVASELSGYGFGGRARNGGGPSDVAWSVVPAQAAVGLPTTVGYDDRPCYAGGQARAVVALWSLFTTTGSDLDGWRGAVAAPSDGIGDAWDAANAPWAITFWPAVWDTDVDPPVVYARSDALLAINLAERGDTRQRLAEGWPRWVRARTSSTELAAALHALDRSNVTTMVVPNGTRTCV